MSETERELSRMNAEDYCTKRYLNNKPSIDSVLNRQKDPIERKQKDVEEIKEAEKMERIKTDIENRKFYKRHASALIHSLAIELYFRLQNDVDDVIRSEIPLPFGYTIPLYGDRYMNRRRFPEYMTENDILNFIRKIIKDFFGMTRGITDDDIEEKLKALNDVVNDYVEDSTKEKIRRDVTEKYGMADLHKQKERLAEVNKKYFDLLTKVCSDILEYTYDPVELQYL